MLFHNQDIARHLFSLTGGKVKMSDLRLRSNKFGGWPRVDVSELRSGSVIRELDPDVEGAFSDLEQAINLSYLFCVFDVDTEVAEKSCIKSFSCIGPTVLS